MPAKRFSSQQINSLSARVPARRLADVSSEVREVLAEGLLETKNLTEWLAVDRPHLATCVFSRFSHCDWWPELRKEIKASSHLSALKFSLWIGQRLATFVHPQDDLWQTLAKHPSDVVREWAACIVGYRSDLTLKEKMIRIRPMADDPNAGLREVAWMALRGDVARDPTKSIKPLLAWTTEKSDRLRRYSSEITRPCGVWCAHIGLLKSKPEIGLPILEKLKMDSSKYVRDSVANWLNDASKTQPDFVLEVTARWKKECQSPNTDKIILRALRTIRNQKDL
jgi:3-methyladenine DNA glycosylase AlkC